MGKKIAKEAELTNDPLDQRVFPLDDKLSHGPLENMDHPPRASDAQKALTKRRPRRGEPTQIEEVFGLLERAGQRAASIEEMHQAVVDQAVESDARSKKR